MDLQANSDDSIFINPSFSLFNVVEGYIMKYPQSEFEKLKARRLFLLSASLSIGQSYQHGSGDDITYPIRVGAAGRRWERAVYHLYA